MPAKQAKQYSLPDVDLNEFKKDMDALKKELQASQGQEDWDHLQRIVFVTEVLAFVATLSLGLPLYYLVSPVLFAIAITARWTMVAHHTSHGGYDYRNDQKYHRKRFGLGFKRRVLDWFDWMLPEAWNAEHNHEHHYHLNEDEDPDLVELNMVYLRGLDIPAWQKRLVVFFLMCTWKWYYYAPNTFAKLAGNDQGMRLVSIVAVLSAGACSLKFRMDYIFKVFLPPFIYRFLLFPLPWMYFGLYWNAVQNLIVADILANIYSFIIIVPNHAGRDLWRFHKHARPNSGEFYRNAIMGSANYALGDDLTDFSQGWLNYQIEHHCFPSLSMLAYRRSVPKVKALCAKHGIPYIQESVWMRLWKTTQVMIGEDTMMNTAHLE